MSYTNDDAKVWYKEFYLWLILAPLIVVVCASMVFMYIAFSQSDDLVVDNYYREGKMLAQDFAADEYAQSIGLSGQAVLKSNRIEVSLNQNARGQQLVLLISHPANADLDMRLTMKRTGEGRYVSALDTDLPGRWYLRLSAFEEDNERWRLHGEADFSNSDSVSLD